MGEVKSKALCSGCYNDDYNRGLGGAKECWMFQNSSIREKIEVHVNQMPPYDLKSAKPMMECYRKPQWCYPSPEQLTNEGYWK